MKLPYQERVIEERKELTAKSMELSSFISTSIPFSKLSELERGLLVAQESAMEAYGRILDIRISLFDI